MEEGELSGERKTGRNRRKQLKKKSSQTTGVINRSEKSGQKGEEREGNHPRMSDYLRIKKKKNSFSFQMRRNFFSLLSPCEIHAQNFPRLFWSNLWPIRDLCFSEPGVACFEIPP